MGIEKITDPQISGEYTQTTLERTLVVNTMINKINEIIDKQNNIDWKTIEFVFMKINECIETGGSLNWARVGEVIDLARKNQEKTITKRN